jgi:CHAT domain-containing protein
MYIVKPRVVMAIVVCTLGALCTDKDTTVRDEWVRTGAPRLTGVAWREYKAQPAAPKGRCETTQPVTHLEAVHILSEDVRCADAAIDALARFAPSDPDVLSDLAGAYLIRAKRDDQPLDLFPALDAADDAVRLRPSSAAAHFNRALVEEEMGLEEDALASWNAARFGSSGWAKEAVRRRDRLVAKRQQSGILQWERIRPQLDAALRRGDAGKVAELIDPYPAAAGRYLENDVLGQWAASGSKEVLAQAKLLATALAARLGDRLLLDSVTAIENATPDAIGALREGHRKFSEARRAEMGFNLANAETSYAEAAQLFARGRTPFRLNAELGYATYVEQLPLLDRLEREARDRRYAHLQARIAWVHGLTFGEHQYLDALEQYETALAGLQALRDDEGIESTRIRRAGVLNIAGQSELAWHDLLQAAHEQNRIVQTKEQQVLFGEIGAAALALGHPRIALRYRTMVIDLLQAEIAAMLPEDEARRDHLHTRLARALQRRSEVEIELRDYSSATVDQKESQRLHPSSDKRVQKLLAERDAEVTGRGLIARSPERAIEELSRALQLSDPESLTFRANLYAQRAVAHRNAKNDTAAEGDLKTALAVLREEENLMLANPKRERAEELWSAYFSRFDDTYALLIRQYVEKGAAKDAFAYLERARGFEPLHRIRQLPYTPKAFQILADKPTLENLQSLLPPGTFILEYLVLDDVTYTWIVTHDDIRLVKQGATRKDVLRWTKDLQEAADLNDDDAFEAGLAAPYHGLIEQPLSIVRTMPGGNTIPRLVVIPDRVMQGLPLAALRSSATAHYLFQDAVLEMQGSALLYAFSLLRDRSLPRDQSLLLFGNPAFDRKLPFAAGLRPLGFAESEIEEVRGLYGPNAQTRVGDEATIAAFLRANQAIVQLSGHAVVNARAPHHSMLLLANTPEDRGVLEAQRWIRDARLDRTRLVILSTCSSVGGTPVGPEGIGPLVRPVITAGVPAVIGTLWNVNDATAKELLVSFHRHFKNGSDAAVALRAAQQELLGSGSRDLQRALTWAPYQVIGHATSPFGPVKTTEKEKPP